MSKQSQEIQGHVMTVNMKARNLSETKLQRRLLASKYQVKQGSSFQGLRPRFERDSYTGCFESLFSKIIVVEKRLFELIILVASSGFIIPCGPHVRRQRRDQVPSVKDKDDWCSSKEDKDDRTPNSQLQASPDSQLYKATNLQFASSTEYAALSITDLSNRISSCRRNRNSQFTLRPN
nr:hypothetical protein [Tanacetum cinerariifolium]